MSASTVETPSPYVLNASDNPGALISSVILQEDNYSEWAVELQNSLQAKQKLGFIDGSIPKPTAEPNLSKWLAANSMIIGWIRTSIDPRIRSTVAFVTDASTLWKNLYSRFSVGNGVRKQFLKDEIAMCRQDGKPVLEYYGRLSKLWEELQNYQTTRECTCAAADDIKTEREADKVHQFLFGLDLPRFTAVRSTITGEDPLPSLNQVYARVIREEQNLNLARSKEVTKPDAIGFSVQSSPIGQVAAVSAPRRDRSTLYCTHCKRQGHDISECFQLHGYPDWYYEQNHGDTSSGRGGSSSSRGRGNNNRGGRPPPSNGRGRGRANNARTSTESLDQITQLIQLLQAQRPDTLPEKLSGNTTLADVIIDTGASHHMTGDASVLRDTVDIVPSPVTFPDGTYSRATQRGTLVLNNTYELPNVLYVPNFDCTLISVAKLLKQTGCIAIFTETLCLLQDRFTRTLIGAGEERDGVYYFTGVHAARVHKDTKDSLSAVLWHSRLGHPSSSLLLPMSSRPSQHELELLKSCEICLRAKQTRTVFPESINKTSSSFDLVHCDVWGPYRTPTTFGSVYFLTLVDDYSRCVWTFLMSAKSEVSKLLQNFCAMSER